MSYYNTTNEAGDQLKESTKKTGNQYERILAFFKKNDTQLLTPPQIRGYVFGNSVPLTSVRRAVTDLTNDGKLTMTQVMRKGEYGKLNHCWKLNDNYERILSFFKKNDTQLLTPPQIRGYVFGNSVPLTSVRRALTDLTNDGKLTMTQVMRKGEYGKLNHCWKLNDNLKPQLNIFND